jgi:pilus assembly protein Flp/PilA
MLKAYSRAVARINSLRDEEAGATATEYALIIGVASIAIVAALALIAPAISNFVTTDIVGKL